MKVNAFVSPLSPHGLQELGRLAVNFGHIEFWLEEFVAGRAGLTDPTMRGELVAPLTLRRKLEILGKTHETHSKNSRAAELLKQACEIINTATVARNDLLHGYWVFSTDEVDVAAASRSSKKPGRTLDAAKISHVADLADEALRLIVQAVAISAGASEESIRFPVNFFGGKGKPPDWPAEPE